MRLTFKQSPIWLASQPIDCRKVIKGLCALFADELCTAPGDGIFVFYNHARNRLKMLAWHINGFMLINKRFEKIN